MTERKKSYAVPCASTFRDEVMALAAARDVNVGDIARSVILILPEAAIAATVDPGEPAPDDRETIILKSGPSVGKPWRRKPRLQVRLPDGHSIENIRRALNLALAMAQGERVLTIEAGDAPSANQQMSLLNDELERLRAIVSALAFSPLENGVQSRAEAFHVLGFAPRDRPNRASVNAKFRMLAAIHHPDSEHGDHRRMSQLNEAIGFLRKSR
jgi:hypothetical protein